MEKYAIIYETVHRMVNNRQQYYKHIVSMVLSIAAVIVLQCMSTSIIPVLFSSDENTNGRSLVTIRSESFSENENINDAILSESEITAALNEVCECAPVIRETICKGEISDIRENADIEAVSDGFWLDEGAEMVYGSPLTDMNWQTGCAAVISDKTAKALFGDENVCGRSFCINTNEYGIIEFTVCGVYLSEHNIENIDETVYVNHRYMVSYYHIENLSKNELTYTVAGKADRESISQSLTRFNIEAAEHSVVITTEYEADKEDDTSAFVTLLMNVLLMFAVMAFFLSNIGIMNMTFIMIGRRTNEIGIRKAVGGQIGDIRLQIITESILTSMAGSLLGILSGLLTGNMILLIVEKIVIHGEIGFKLCIPWRCIIISAAGTFILSTVLSLFPADKAARMTVTEAIRARE